jgi:hypothetical protein
MLGNRASLSLQVCSGCFPAFRDHGRSVPPAPPQAFPPLGGSTCLSIYCHHELLVPLASYLAWRGWAITSHRRGGLVLHAYNRSCPNACRAPTPSNSSGRPRTESVHYGARCNGSLAEDSAPYAALCLLQCHAMARRRLWNDTSARGGAGTSSHGKRRCPSRRREQSTHTFRVSQPRAAAHGRRPEAEWGRRPVSAGPRRRGAVQRRRHEARARRCQYSHSSRRS